MILEFMHRYIIAAAAIFVPMLTGCYSDIDLDRYRDKDIEERLVLNSILMPDSLVRVVATHPYFFADQHHDPSYEKGLDLRLSVNGVDAGNMTYDNNRDCYLADVTPEEGDVVEIRTLWKGKTVEARDTMPQKIRIEDFSATIDGPFTIHQPDSWLIEYDITFTDPAEEENFYFLSFGGRFKGEFLLDGERLYKNEFVFQVLAEIMNSTVPGWEPYSLTGLPFSDKGIEGKRHTLHVGEILPFVWNPDDYVGREREVTLYSISRAYYDFMLSLLANDPEDDSIHGSFLGFGLLEPDGLYSNVNGGTGIIGSCVKEGATALITRKRPSAK